MKSIYIKSIFFLSCFILIHVTPTFSQSKSELLDQLVFGMYENNQFSGTVAVVDHGELIYKKAYGWANYEKKDTFKLSTPCRLASVSKQFTAMAIMILKEKGQLSYEDDITMYLPELPYDNVKIKHLLSHCSGITDYFWLEEDIEKTYWHKEVLNNADIVDYFATYQPLLQFTPGSKASYSNTGYVFLASIVERVSRVPFATFMKENIFNPLQMNHTFIYNAQNYDKVIKKDTVLLRVDTITLEKKFLKTETFFKLETSITLLDKPRAIGYELSFPYPNGYILRDFDELDGVVGEKGICASMDDLLKWDEALHKHTLVSKKTLDEAFSPGYVTDNEKFDYGFGWKIYRKKEKRGIVYHHGQYRGFRTFLQRNPFDKTTIIILNNRMMDDGAIYDMIEAIEEILQYKDFKFPKQTLMEKLTLKVFKEEYRIDYKNTVSGGSN